MADKSSANKSSVEEGSELSFTMEDYVGPSKITSECASSSINSSESNFDDFGQRPTDGDFRLMREVRQQISTLQKENFDLRLRIYFFEEKMTCKFTLDKNNIIRKNVDSQIEKRNLTRELKEKHELFVQAAKALELQEKHHQKYIASTEKQATRLHGEIKDMKALLDGSVLRKNVESRRFTTADSSPDRQSVKETDNTESDKKMLQKIDAIQKDCEGQDATIEGLNHELLSANKLLLDYDEKLEYYKEKLRRRKSKNTDLLSQMREAQDIQEKVRARLTDVTEKYDLAKSKYERDCEKIEGKKFLLERNKQVLELQVSLIKVEKQMHNKTINEHQEKLETTLANARKNHKLAYRMQEQLTELRKRVHHQ